MILPGTCACAMTCTCRCVKLSLYSLGGQQLRDDSWRKMEEGSGT